jgi:hypothetical protein
MNHSVSKLVKSTQRLKYWTTELEIQEDKDPQEVRFSQFYKNLGLKDSPV